MKKHLAKFILTWLKYFAKLQLKRYSARQPQPVLIGLTASAGKTSLMSASKTILSSKYKVRVSDKANSESGIPLHILGLKMTNYSIFDWLRVMLMAPLQLFFYNPKFDKYIFELGVDKPDDMEYLLSIVQPQIGIFMNAGNVHAANFARFKDPATAIALEKGRLIKSLPEDGWAIINYDQKEVRQTGMLTRAQTIYTTKGTEAEKELPPGMLIFAASQIKTSLDGFSMKVSFQGRDYSLQIKNQFLGEHYADVFLSALALAHTQNIQINTAIEALEKNFTLPPGRTSIISGIKKTTIIDSSYNSSPLALEAMLKALDKINKKTKIAVLGDMRELGEYNASQHRRLARIAAKVADMIVTVGPEMKNYFVPAAIKTGFAKSKIHSFINPFEAIQPLREKIIKGGEVILVKGSQNTIFLESVVKSIMANPEDAAELLCRQEAMWQKKRAQLKLELKQNN